MNQKGQGAYAVIFISKRTGVQCAEYHQAAERMVELVNAQPGFLGVDSVRGEDGVGITISYWESEESIKAWRDHAEHIVARNDGRASWYEWFQVKVVKIERSYAFGTK